jgi:hypothetical protein
MKMQQTVWKHALTGLAGAAVLLGTQPARAATDVVVGDIPDAISGNTEGDNYPFVELFTTGGRTVTAPVLGSIQAYLDVLTSGGASVDINLYQVSGGIRFIAKIATLSSSVSGDQQFLSATATPLVLEPRTQYALEAQGSAKIAFDYVSEPAFEPGFATFNGTYYNSSGDDTTFVPVAGAAVFNLLLVNPE